MKHNLFYLIAAAFAFVGCVKVPEPAQPIPGAKADFKYSEATPYTVTFYNQSNSTRLTPWLWEFGDGASSGSETQQVTHKYSKAGSYSVTLTCKDENRISYTCTKTITVVGDGGTPPDPKPEDETYAYIKGFTYYKLPFDKYHYKTEITIPSLFQDPVTVTSNDRQVRQSDLPLKLTFNNPKKVCKTADWIYCSAVMVDLYYNMLGTGYDYKEITVGDVMITNERKTEYIVTSDNGNTKIGVTIEYK